MSSRAGIRFTEVFSGRIARQRVVDGLLQRHKNLGRHAAQLMKRLPVHS